MDTIAKNSMIAPEPTIPVSMPKAELTEPTKLLIRLSAKEPASMAAALKSR